MQSKYNKEFDILKSDWENIYMNKIVLLHDKKISEFNYKLLNNLLSNNYFVSKIDKSCDCMCKICTEKVENSHHLIFECVNVQHTWKIVSNLLGFDVKWKHIVIGFYSVRNETTAMYNLLL